MTGGRRPSILGGRESAGYAPSALIAAVAVAVAAAASCAPSGSMEGNMEGKTVSVMGKELYYVESGSGSPVVLVHGNTGSSRWWKKVMALDGRRVVALDLPNFGRSARLDSADIDLYADYLAAFIGALGLERPVVVGHSLGGAVVMSMAARNPGLPAGVVIVDGAAPSGLVTLEAHYPYFELIRADRGLMRKALAAVAPTMTDEAFLDEIVDDAMLMAPFAFEGNPRALARLDYTGRAGAFTGPALVVWGRKDTIITEAMARETAAAYPNGRLLILDSVGHSVMVEDPEGFERILLDYLDGVR